MAITNPLRHVLFVLSTLSFTLLSPSNPAPVLGAGPAPSPEHPVGWRGDGTGRYPEVTPPIHWQRLAKTSLTDFRASADKPAAESAPANGPPMNRARAAFHPAEWLVLGPLSPDDPPKAIEQEIVPNEAALTPGAGQTVGAATWKVAKVGASAKDLDLLETFGAANKPEKDRLVNQAAYLGAYLWAPEATDAGIRLEGDRGDARIWLNGKPASLWEGERHKFVRGWNRLLVKLVRRGRIDQWSFDLGVFPVAGPDLRYESQNIHWVTEMPGPSFSMPIIVGDKLLVTSEPGDLLCLEKNTGKILWMRSDTLWHGATGSDPPADDKVGLDRYRPLAEKLDALNDAFVAGNTILPDAKAPPDASIAARAAWELGQRQRFLEERRHLAGELTDGVKKLNRKYGVSFGWGGGNSVPTPVSDGLHVYAWRGETGVLSCYDLEGNRVYTRFQHAGSGGEHGINASPALVGDKLIVLAGQRWIAFDKNTGRTLWTQKYAHVCYASAIPAKAGNVDVLVAPDGQVVRAADGQVLSKAFGPYDGECASPVIDDRQPDTFYLIARGGFCAARLAARADEAPAAAIIARLTPDQLQDTETYPVGSPVTDGGLVYATHSGWGPKRFPVLLVIDPTRRPPPAAPGGTKPDAASVATFASATVIYRQPLDMSPSIHYAPDGAGIAASLALAGGHLYCLDNRGETIVFEPGRSFHEIARNVIEDLGREGRAEVTNGTPIFEGRRMYLRGEHNLYCVEER